jgi:hypothetical protein
MASLAATKTLAADNKLAKSTVQYEDVAKKKGTDCATCTQFIPGKQQQPWQLPNSQRLDGQLSAMRLNSAKASAFPPGLCF